MSEAESVSASTTSASKRGVLRPVGPRRAMGAKKSRCCRAVVLRDGAAEAVERRLG